MYVARRSYLHFIVQSASVLQEGLHHFLADGEIWGKFRTAFDQTGIHAVQELVPIKVVVLPVVENVRWGKMK